MTTLIKWKLEAHSTFTIISWFGPKFYGPVTRIRNMIRIKNFYFNFFFFKKPLRHLLKLKFDNNTS
jgi:hypothetical protein